MILKETETLIVDCQATGANPDNGHLIEIGWMRYIPGQEGTLTSNAHETHLIELPKDICIPKHVERVTGISPEDLVRSITPADAWTRLFNAAQRIGQSHENSRCLAVIHFARYETPFLRYLHGRVTPDLPFPFEIICTHEIARRLLPGLPRKGLRAVAGYFGFSTPEKRRCAHHLDATLSIWRRVVELLEQEHGIRTLEDLIAWLGQVPQNQKQGRVFPMERTKRLKMPDAPGVYRFLRSNGDLLYIGKAKSLKIRVNSYFQQNRKQPEHVLEMLSQACDIDYTRTGSAAEAAILETDEIKKVSPPYNIALKAGGREIGFSAKGFMSHSPKPDKKRNLGPFPAPDVLAPLAILSKLTVSREAQTEDVPVVLSIPDDYIPDLAVFQEGLVEFCKRYDTALRPDSIDRSLIRLGALFWKKKLEAEDEIIEDADDPEETESDEIEDEPWEWTPDAVANAIERVVRRCVHLIRRARWFCLISESILVWERGHEKESHRHYLVFRKGRLAGKGVLAVGEDIPFPSGYQRNILVRQQGFDVATYDRMRVVTTEIRRLVSEKRNVQLCTRPNALMKTERLKQFLQWV